ncbi:ubiquitinyl hydrolase 1 [Sarracenia purpurea var. burkii]
MHVSGFPLDLNWFLQFIVTAFFIALGLLHLVKNTASKYFMVDANFESSDSASASPTNGRKMPGVVHTDDSCVVCGNLTKKQCSGCKLVRYCSEQCQKSHWKSGHKTKCKDFQLSGKVNTSQPASMQRGRIGSSSVALVPDSGTTNIIKQSKEILFPYEDFVELFNWDKPGFPPCGLLNCGNSCFANVVLQCLAYTRPLVAFLLKKGHRKECRRNDWCFLCEFQTHVERASESQHPFSPINILSRLPNIGGNLGYGKQEDAHEFMRFAIDTMQSVCLDEFGGEKALDLSTQETTLIQHIFGGHLQSQVICTKCNNISNQYENMMDLTVEIQGDAGSLEECLDQFTVREQLHGENMYKCDGCNDYVMAWKRLTVRRAPNILTIALKRFQSGRFGKLNKRVTFPETLDLSPYMSEAGDGKDVYKLYAVVVHVDMLNASFFGHYICYTKDFRGNWYRIDDCKVTSVDLEEVLSQGAYMLLYSRVCARSSCLKSFESLGKERQTVKVFQEEEPSPKQSVECFTTEKSITNGICTSSSSSSISSSQATLSTCERDLSAISHCEDDREDIEMVNSESSSSISRNIEVHSNGYSDATEESAAPVVHANRLVSGAVSSQSLTLMSEDYSLNSESASRPSPNFDVDDKNRAERNGSKNLPDYSNEKSLPSVGTKRLGYSSGESCLPMQNGVYEKGKMSHDVSLGCLSSAELLDKTNPVDSKCEHEKMEIGELAGRKSSGGKLKPLFPPGFLGKRPGNKSMKREDGEEASSEKGEFTSYNVIKSVSGFPKSDFLQHNGAMTEDAVKPQFESPLHPTLQEHVVKCTDKATTVLSEESGEFPNICNGDSSASVISDKAIRDINRDDRTFVKDSLSYNDDFHWGGMISPEKIATDSATLVETDHPR